MAHAISSGAPDASCAWVVRSLRALAPIGLAVFAALAGSAWAHAEDGRSVIGTALWPLPTMADVARPKYAQLVHARGAKHGYTLVRAKSGPKPKPKPYPPNVDPHRKPNANATLPNANLLKPGPSAQKWLGPTTGLAAGLTASLAAAHVEPPREQAKREHLEAAFENMKARDYKRVREDLDRLYPKAVETPGRILLLRGLAKLQEGRIEDGIEDVKAVRPTARRELLEQLSVASLGVAADAPAKQNLITVASFYAASTTLHEGRFDLVQGTKVLGVRYSAPKDAQFTSVRDPLLADIRHGRAILYRNDSPALRHLDFFNAPVASLREAIGNDHALVRLSSAPIAEYVPAEIVARDVTFMRQPTRTGEVAAARSRATRSRPDCSMIPDRSLACSTLAMQSMRGSGRPVYVLMPRQ